MPTPNDQDIDALSPSGEEITGQTPQGEGSEEIPGKKSAEARINELIAQVKTLEEKIVKQQATVAPSAPTTPTPVANPQLEQAVKLLKDAGFVQMDQLRQEIQTIKDITALNGEHNKMEQTYDGADGRPKYNRSEIEAFMRERGVYDPQIAYDQLHKTELFDWELKNVDEKKKKEIHVEKPGLSSARRTDNTITRETIAEWMKTPEGRVKYEQNRDKIFTLMQQGFL